MRTRPGCRTLALGLAIGLLAAFPAAAELTAEERATLNRYTTPQPMTGIHADSYRAMEAYDLAARLGAESRVDGFEAILETGSPSLMSKFANAYRAPTLPPRMEQLIVTHWDKPKMATWWVYLTRGAKYQTPALYDRLAQHVVSAPHDRYAAGALVNTDLPDLPARLAKLLPRVDPGSAGDFAYKLAALKHAAAVPVIAARLKTDPPYQDDRSRRLLWTLAEFGTSESYQAVAGRLAKAAREPASQARNAEMETCTAVLARAPQGVFVDLSGVRSAFGKEPLPEPLAKLLQDRTTGNLRAVAMTGDLAMVRALKAAGVDAAAEMKKDPQYLLAALRPEATVEGLAYVLASGADPSSAYNGQIRTPALFEARYDGAKIALLLAHGADVNVKHQGYTLLAQVLFSHNRTFKVMPDRRDAVPLRTYDKLELVRLLVDKGARINADNGGRGDAGALLHARKEEPDVIAFLLERGATLDNRHVKPFFEPQTAEEKAAAAERPTLGPVSIAIVHEREDLALALLRRDGKVHPGDGRALAKAVRVGYSSLALELIRLGADVNAADRDGTTPQAAAERRRDAAVLAALQAAGARPAAARMPTAVPDAVGGSKAGSFEALAARAFDELLLSDPPRLYFGLANREHEPPAFMFYGDSHEKPEIVRCEEAVGFKIYYQANETSGVTVGRCAKDVARLRALAESARAGMDRTLGLLTREGGVDPRAAEQLGLRYEKTSGPGGAQVFNFSIVLIGHGLFVVPTTVVISPTGDRAVVVQGELSRFCGRGPRSPICEDSPRALSRLAQSLHAAPR